jgi:hypothetical protein
LSFYYFKEELLQINDLNFFSRKLENKEKNQTKPSLERKESKKQESMNLKTGK